MTHPALQPGELVANKYRIEKELGRGGMGAVYLANDTELERQVAIKALLEEHAADRAQVTRFLREAKASAKIKSEHVAHVYETGRLASGAPFIVMEYLQGWDLADRLERTGPFEVAEIVDLMLQTCEALAEAHAAGIVHRDLKPANLFLARRPDGSDTLKILDFGISKISTSSVLTRSQTLVGSPYYMSPEQLESAEDIDARADIWALGVIMYELCAGKRPFEGTSLAALCVAVLNSTPPPLQSVVAGVDRLFEELVMRCLQKERGLRCQNVGELATALAAMRPGSDTGRAVRVTKVLQNARTVPDTPRLEKNPSPERSHSFAQTNRESTVPDKQGRRYAWAAVVIIAAGGIGAGVGHWVRVEPATNAVETTALKEMTLAHPTQLDLEKATAVSPHAPKQLESTVQAARTSRTPSPSVSVAPGPNVSVELVAPQNSARALELNANADRPLKPTRSSPAAAETKQGSRTRQAVGQSSGEVGMPVRDPFLRRH